MLSAAKYLTYQRSKEILRFPQNDIMVPSGFPDSLLQVTPTPPAQGALYTRRFDLPFPYLCDPGYTMYRRYGLASKGALAALRAVMESLPDVLQRSVTGEQPSLVPYVSGGLAAGSTEQGMFLIDRNRRVRFRHIADVPGHIPSHDTLLTRWMPSPEA